MVFDMTLRGQHQRLAAPHRAQPGQVLGGDAVQPGEPVRAADAHHLAVRPVDEGGAVAQRALFPQRVAVVGGDRRVVAGRRHRAGQVEQRGSDGFGARGRPSAHGVESRSPRGPHAAVHRPAGQT